MPDEQLRVGLSGRQAEGLHKLPQHLVPKPRRVFEAEAAAQHPQNFREWVEVPKPRKFLQEVRAARRDGKLDVPADFVLHLRGLLERQPSQEGLRDVRGEQRPPILGGNRVHQALAPACSSPRVRGQLGRLQVLEAANHKPGLDDTSIVDDLPCEHPACVDNVRGVLLEYTLERTEVQPALKFPEHSPITLRLVLECLLTGEDVLGSLHDGLLDSRREHLDHIMFIVAQRWQLLAVRWNE